jgi:hypothetical protein
LNEAQAQQMSTVLNQKDMQGVEINENNNEFKLIYPLNKVISNIQQKGLSLTFEENKPLTNKWGP